MNGENLRTGGVRVASSACKNPIRAARLVLEESPHVYFVGSGAERFATQHGMRLIDNTELIVPRERDRLMQFQRNEAAGGSDTTFSGNSEFTAAPFPPSSNPPPTRHPEQSSSVSSTDAAGISRSSVPATNLAPNSTQTFSDAALDETALEAEVDRALPDALRFDDPTLHSHDTVGAVALDRYGNLAAGTSTGGTLSKAPGRVGDSSLIGCGCYADNLSAAVSLTGWGEPIMKLVLGKWAVDRVAAGSTPQQAAADAIAYLHTRLGGHGGIILMGPDGSLGLAHNTPRMAWGIRDIAGAKLGITRHEQASLSRSLER